MDLIGLHALVTGAGTGTGRAIAERLAAEGTIMHVSDIDAAGSSTSTSVIVSESTLLSCSSAAPLR